MKRIILFLLTAAISTALQAQKFEGLALTPPMGWNSWNKLKADINEAKIKAVADKMVASGMKDAGYEYIVIDDCWQAQTRDENGRLVADPKKFPSGMKALADYIHSKGLKFGIYADAGTKTCAGYPGSRGYEFLDAKTFADWGVDYLKYDWCNHGKQKAEPSYITMSEAIKKAGRPMVFSICEWGTNTPWKWAAPVGHLWRTTNDIVNEFDVTYNWGGLGVLQIIDKQVGLRTYAGPGQWNDPDMLEIGNGVLTLAESRVQFSMWCMLAAPLIAGNDLSAMTPEIAKILTNKEIIAVNQDKLGIVGLKWKDYGDFEIWFKPLENDAYAVCFLNRGNKGIKQKFTFKDKHVFDLEMDWTTYKFPKTYTVRNLWTHNNLGTVTDTFNIEIPPHDVLMVKLFKK